MLHDPELPRRLDHESRALARRFLAPLFDAAETWTDLVAALSAHGYRLRFRAARLVVEETVTGTGFCTGTDLGHPLADLSLRLGRPRLRLGPDGRSAELV